MEMKEDMLFLCIERVFRLINGCKNLEMFFADCRSSTIILGEMRNTKTIGEHLREKEN
jgi:hypothetical protein